MRKTNFHCVADLAASDSPTEHTVMVHSERVDSTPTIFRAHADFSCLKVRMEPSPRQSLQGSRARITSRGTQHACHSTTRTKRPLSPCSPAVSEDSGYGRDLDAGVSPRLHPSDTEDSSNQETEAHLKMDEKLRKYRKQRTVFESAQLQSLEDTFSINPYPSSEEYESLSKRICIDEPRLRIWFQNRRARYRRSAKHSPPIMSRHTAPFSLPAYSNLTNIPVMAQLNHTPLMMYNRTLFGSY